MHRTLKPLIFAFLALPLVLPASPAQAAPAGSNDPSRAVPGEVVVGFAGDTSKRARERAAARVDATARTGVARGSGEVVQLMELPGGVSNAGAIDRLRRDPAVEFAEPNWIYTTRPPRTTRTTPNGSLWGHVRRRRPAPPNQYGSQAGEAWAAGQDRQRRRLRRRHRRGHPVHAPRPRRERLDQSRSTRSTASTTTATATSTTSTAGTSPATTTASTTAAAGQRGRPRHARRGHHRRRAAATAWASPASTGT